MTSIRSFAEILLEAEDLDARDARNFVRIILEESIRLIRLLDEILEISRLEQGQLKMDSVPFSPELVLNKAIDSIRGLAAQNGTRIETGERVASATVTGDPDRLHQVIINLLNNSIKYNSSSDPVVTVYSEISEETYSLLVKDNGPGVLELDKVFEKFSRGREHTHKGHTGSGLGLPISREIIREMDGDLSLESVNGSGACFRIELPLVDSPHRDNGTVHAG